MSTRVEKSLIGHSDANQVWQISGKRVFQQTQAFTLATVDLCRASNPKRCGMCST